MELLAPSVFVDKAAPPTEDGIEDAMGQALTRWDGLRARLARELGPVEETWSFGGRRHGWSLRIARGDRVVAYLTPLPDGFRAALAIPERAMPAVLGTGLPAPVLALAADAPVYPEGRAIRMAVRSDADADAVLALARIRMAS
jgi:hypothetical protein